MSICLSSSERIAGEKVSLLSAKYRHIGLLESAGEKVMNQDGAPLKEISDQISLCIYFLLVTEPHTCLPTWSRSCINWKHSFSLSVSGLTRSPPDIHFVRSDS